MSGSRDLFGQAGERSHERRRPSPQGPDLTIPAARQSLRPQHYFSHDKYCYTRDDLIARSGWKSACEQYPDKNIVIVLDTTQRGCHSLCLIALPKKQPPRFDGKGKPIPSYPPFWGHGDVMHIDKVIVPP